jgi:hypothetical protein
MPSKASGGLVYSQVAAASPWQAIGVGAPAGQHYWLEFAFGRRATSRAGSKEGREPDRNVLMYLRTGSAGPTQLPARIVARR